jgi:hypothetical protein
MENLKLFLVHCGFYDQQLCGGVFESHVCFMEVAPTPLEAKIKTKARPEVTARKMHVDGIQEVAIPGYALLINEVNTSSNVDSLDGF